MKDFLAQLEHIEKQIAECDLISNLATDSAKGEVFAALANQYRAMAESIRQAIGKVVLPPRDNSSLC